MEINLRIHAHEYFRDCYLNFENLKISQSQIFNFIPEIF